VNRISTISLQLYLLVDGVETGYYYGGGYLKVVLLSSALAGETLGVHISYNGFPQVHSTSFWGEGIYFFNKVIYSLQCPEGSRYWYPSWDKPFDKAKIEMVFTVPDTLFLCSNGVLVDSTNTGGGMITYSWRHDYPAATYLQMFAASKYVQLKDTTHTVPIIHYVYHEDSAKAVADFAVIPDALDCYSALFGTYPFDKFGFSESAVGGAMEHQTNVSVGSFLITGTGAYELIFVHELSHQWWGDMVTLVDWRHCWLNEGFATYSEALWWEYLYGKQGLKDYVIILQDQYLSWEAGGHLFPIFDPPLEHLFSTTTYEKGACVLHMLRFLVGDSLFFSILRTYGEIYKYKNASTDDFKNIAETVSGKDLDWFFNEWIYGGGSPRFLYTVFCDTNSIPFSIITMSETNTETPYRMPCEVVFILESGTIRHDTVIIDPSLKESIYSFSIPLKKVVFDNLKWILTRGFIHALPELSYALPGEEKVDLFWYPFYDTTLYTYNVFYSTDSTGGWIKANPSPCDSTHYVVSDLVNNQVYYFRINGINSKGYESDASNIVSAKPMGFPMDRGLLVVDETKDGNGSSPILPTDEQVDSFYDYCIAPVSYRQWDCADKGIPPLDTLVHYTQVFWHDDDMGNSTIDECGEGLITYCYNGGGFVLSGWRTMKSFIPSMIDFYGIEDESEIVSAKFKGVYGMNGYSDMSVDTTKMFSSWDWMLKFG